MQFSTRCDDVESSCASLVQLLVSCSSWNIRESAVRGLGSPVRLGSAPRLAEVTCPSSTRVPRPACELVCSCAALVRAPHTYEHASLIVLIVGTVAALRACTWSTSLPSSMCGLIELFVNELHANKLPLTLRTTYQGTFLAAMACRRQLCSQLLSASSGISVRRATPSKCFCWTSAEQEHLRLSAAHLQARQIKLLELATRFLAIFQRVWIILSRT